MAPTACRECGTQISTNVCLKCGSVRRRRIATGLVTKAIAWFIGGLVGVFVLYIIICLMLVLMLLLTGRAVQ